MTTPVRYHPDHEKLLRRVKLRFPVAKTLASTIDALVGLCCRYALAMAALFIANLYSLLSFIELCASDVADGITYADLIACVLRAPKNEVGHTANVFDVPHGVPSKNKWPTLSKLRVIEALVNEDFLTVPSILDKLALHGIPAPVGVQALNSLQDKYRMLLWLTTNEPVEDDPKSFESLEVTLSEHGAAYYERVIGDFEYVWHCARAFEARKLADSPVRFTAKLRGYVRTVETIGQIEWKQIAFERTRKDSPGYINTRSAAHQMIVLDVLYCSMAAALHAIRIAAEFRSDIRGMVTDLSEQVVAICNQIEHWQHRYVIAYGGNYFRDVYHQQIDEMITEITHELADPILLSNALERLRTLHDSWLEESQVEVRAGVIPFPRVSFVEQLEGLGSHSNEAESERSEKMALAHITGYRDLKDEYRATLANRLPSYTDIVGMCQRSPETA